jgi:hypothetical protein
MDLTLQYAVFWRRSTVFQESYPFSRSMRALPESVFQLSHVFKNLEIREVAISDFLKYEVLALRIFRVFRYTVPSAEEKASPVTACALHALPPPSVTVT